MAPVTALAGQSQTGGLSWEDWSSEGEYGVSKISPPNLVDRS